jgi:hypothetical protein
MKKNRTQFTVSGLATHLDVPSSEVAGFFAILEKMGEATSPGVEIDRPEKAKGRAAKVWELPAKIGGYSLPVQEVPNGPFVKKAPVQTGLSKSEMTGVLKLFGNCTPDQVAILPQEVQDTLALAKAAKAAKDAADAEAAAAAAEAGATEPEAAQAA